jgi:hypothetical protein
MPDDARDHLEVGRLFARANDDVRALTHFQRALRLEPDNGGALAGAGQAAFRLGQYSLARRYLQRAPNDAAGVRETRDVANLVVSADPMIARLGAAERRRRLEVNFQHARQRFSACSTERTESPSSTDVAMQSDLQAFERRLKQPTKLDQDTIESGVDLIDRVERHVVERCGPPDALDRALLLIGREHGGDSR